MKIKKINSMILIVCLMFALSFGFADAVVYYTSINATDDSYTYNNSADTNYGNSINLYVRNNETPEIYDTYLEYIISNIPDDHTIDYVELCLYADWINSTGKNITIYFLDAIIDENLIKWEHNYRADILYNYNKSYEFNNSDLDKYTCIDITSLVNYGYSISKPTLDLIIVGSDNSIGSVKFSSKEGTYPTYIAVNYSTDYTNLCKYNAFAGSTITTCNLFVGDNHCNKMFDENDFGPIVADVEWAVGSAIPPSIPKLIAVADEPFYFDRIEFWQRALAEGSFGAKRFEVSVYSPETDTWYLLINETNTLIKDGVIEDEYRFGGVEVVSNSALIPYLKNTDTIYLGNLSISMVQLKIYESTSVDGGRFAELGFCMMDVEDPEDAYSNYTSYEEAGIGVGCDTNDDCECQLCEYGFCALRTTNMNCIINETSRDDCCLSGSCSGGKCTKAGLWESIEASKDQQFGDTSGTNNFISLFFIIAISGFLMYYGNVIGGIFALYILSIFFVVVGWLSPFILIGMIITGLIAMFFKVTMGGSSE